MSSRRSSQLTLCLQQAPLQQQLHVTPPVRDDEDVDRLLDHPVDDAVGLEEDLPVLSTPNVEQLARIAPTLGMLGQTLERTLDLIQYVVRPGLRIVARDVIADLAWKYVSGDGGNAGTSLRVSGRGSSPG